MDRPVSLETRRIDCSSELPFAVGRARIDPPAHEVRIRDKRTRIQPQTLKVLIALHDRIGEVVTRDELIDRCWDGRIVGEDVINRCISLLRRTAESGGFTIETVPCAGYRLVDGAVAARGFRRWWVAVAVVVVLGTILAAVIVTREADRRQGSPPMPTIALLPFGGDEADPKVRELANSTRASLAHTLAEGGFPVRLVAPEAVSSSKAELIISGDIVNENGAARADVWVEEAEHRALIYSEQLQATGTDIDLLSERVGAQVAAVLSWTGALMALDQGHISDPQSRLELLRQIALTVRGGNRVLDSYKISRRIAPREPKSAFAQLSLAMDTGFALGELPSEERPDALAQARKAGDAARALAPEFGDIYIPPCLLYSPVRRTECEQSLREGLRADPDAPFVAFFLSVEMSEVGRSAEALNLARLSLANDRYKLFKIARVLRTLETQRQSYDAERLFQQADRWWPKSVELAWNRWFGMLSNGNWAEIEQFERNTDQSVFPPEDREPPGFIRAVRSGDLKTVRKLCEHAAGLSLTCMMALQQLGDLDSAFAIADRLYPELRGSTRQEQDSLWLGSLDAEPVDILTGPGAAPMRRDPRFFAIAARQGLLDYWRRVHLPDFCTVRHEPLCGAIRPVR